jgi:hypothetical protein
MILSIITIYILAGFFLTRHSITVWMGQDIYVDELLYFVFAVLVWPWFVLTSYSEKVGRKVIFKGKKK